MDTRFEKPMLAKIKDDVEHQGIGGKMIVIERADTISYVLDYNLNNMTIGLYNFVIRRPDILDEEHEDMKLYYGHVGALGYFVAEDELVEEPREVSWDEAYKYLQ